MRLSNLNIKKINLNDIDKDYSGQSILMKLGELYQYESGIYGYGNLWTKLERIVEDIIITELDKVGCIQVEFPKLQPKSIWERSNRWDLYTKDNDIMFTLSNNLGDYGLAPTAEECATLFGSNRLLSYKNLPAIYYQINEKFRKEIRTRGYLFRPRMFVMMDAYSFDKDYESMKKTYDLMHKAYMNIFKKLGINIIPTVSDNGTMGGNVSEEFQAITNLGEDTILYDKENNIGLNKEVLDFEDRDTYVKQFGVEDLSKFSEYSAVELGNNFQLGTKYSEAMNLCYKDENGCDKPYYMGCYGIGVGRIIAVLIENNVIRDGDKIKGFSLPKNIAPYKIQIVYKDSKVDVATKLYNDLLDKNIGTILDDRNGYSLGNKIKDAYVLGTPYIAIIGNKMEEGKIEIEDTKTGEKMLISIDKIANFLKENC